MRRVIERKCTVNGHSISDIRYAEYTLLISDDDRTLQEIMVRLK